METKTQQQEFEEQKLRQQEFEEQKLRQLCGVLGYDNAEEMVSDWFDSGTVPGICMNEHCDCNYQYEPDQEAGWCDECQTNTVKSGFILYGII